MVRWMLTRWSPNTVIRLVELPIGGNWIKVALSLMTVLRSSARSVIIQSSFLGRIAVSREMMPLLWQKRNCVRDWKQNHDDDMPCSVIVEVAYPAHAGPRKIRLRSRRYLCSAVEG